MKARIINQPARVYSKADLNSAWITELAVGSEVEVGNVIDQGGKSWVGVTLSPGQYGYLRGNTPIFPLRPASLLQGNVPLYSGPSAESAVTAHLDQDTQFELTEVVKQGNKNWAKIRLPSGSEGFIDGTTKVKFHDEPDNTARSTGQPRRGTGQARRGASSARRAAAMQAMLYGGGVCAVGILLTVLTYTFADYLGGTYVVTWGAILFGGLQFLRGVFLFVTA